MTQNVIFYPKILLTFFRLRRPGPRRNLLGRMDGTVSTSHLWHSPHCGERGAKHSPRTTGNQENLKKSKFRFDHTRETEHESNDQILETNRFISKIEKFSKICPTWSDVPAVACISWPQRELALLYLERALEIMQNSGRPRSGIEKSIEKIKIECTWRI